MKNLLLVMALGLAGVCLQAQNSVMAGGATPDGWMTWGRTGATVGLEGAYQESSRETERAPQEWVRGLDARTLDLGLSLRWRWRRVALYGSGGVSRQRAVHTFQFLYPEPSARFGEVEWHTGAYGAATGTVRLFWRVQAFGRYTQRFDAAMANRYTIAGGFGVEF